MPNKIQNWSVLPSELMMFDFYLKDCRVIIRKMTDDNKKSEAWKLSQLIGALLNTMRTLPITQGYESQVLMQTAREKANELDVILKPTIDANMDELCQLLDRMEDN